MVRAPLSLKKLVYLDGQKAVLYRSRMNPSLGRNFEAAAEEVHGSLVRELEGQRPQEKRRGAPRGGCGGGCRERGS